MYLDTDVVLAALKDDDWLASDVDVTELDEPKTSVATAIEVQYAMEGEWDRETRSRAAGAIADAGVELVSLTVDHVHRGGALLREYDRLNTFDAVHLGAALELDEPIVSTDSLYPAIEEVESVDPRELDA